MRGLAREALVYGSSLQGVQTPSYAVTVILNPVASGGKGRKKYEEYCAPLLHLAGLKVSVIRTESEGQAKDIMEIMDDADAVLVAGGDGVLLETVTGLMRRKDHEQVCRNIPLGVLPVGRTNTLAQKLVGVMTGEDHVRLMGEATMNVVRQLRKPVGVIELENQGEERKGQKVYGVNSVKLGAFTDSQRRADKYWLFWGLKKYVTYVGSYLTGHTEVNWDCDLDIQYTQSNDSGTKGGPASSQSSSGWISWLGGSDLKQTKAEVNGANWVKWPERFRGSQIDIEPVDGTGLLAQLYRGELGLQQFVQHGWAIVGGKEDYKVENQTISTNSLFMDPGNQTKLLSLDGEDIEMDGPVQVSYLRDRILMFCSKSDSLDSELTENQPTVARWSAVNSLTARKLH